MAPKKSTAAIAPEPEPLNLTVSTNLVLSPEGVKDVLEYLHQHDKNPSITYDAASRGFRIQCRLDEQDTFVARVRSSLNELVQSKAQQAPLHNAMTPITVFSPDGWDEEQLQQEQFCDTPWTTYPYCVASCAYQDTWSTPAIGTERGSIAIEMMFPGSMLPTIQQLTGAVLTASPAGHAVYIGAASLQTITAVRRKLDTLAKFYSTRPGSTSQVLLVALHHEGENPTTGEYRGLEDGVANLQKGYILDRLYWQEPEAGYSRIFRLGVVVRCNPGNVEAPESPEIPSSPAVAGDAHELMVGNSGGQERVYLSDGHELAPEDPISVVVTESTCEEADPFKRLWVASRQKFKADIATQPRTTPRGTSDLIGSEMMRAAAEALEVGLTPFTMWSGLIEFRIDLGRFCFTNLGSWRVQKPGEVDISKRYEFSVIESELNARHKTNDDLYFTRILTTLSAESKSLASFVDKHGYAMWTLPETGRSSIYEFTCRACTVDGPELGFVVDIDRTTFAPIVRQLYPEHQGCVAVHCTKRAWDFQISFSVYQDLSDICGQFATEFASSLKVSSEAGGVTELDVSYNKGYNVEVLAVRIRNTACYISVGGECDQRLHVSEVWELDRRSVAEDDQLVKLKFGSYEKDQVMPSHPLKWYEAQLTSQKISNQLQTNQGLELGDEGSWKAEELLRDGSFDGLIRKATNMVKNMDDVGRQNDNQQRHSLQPQAVPDSGRPDPEDHRYW